MTNRVIAFEASPPNTKAVQHNIDKNGLNDRAQLVPTAMGKEAGTMKFTLENSTGQTGWGGLLLEDRKGSVEVAVDTLDNYAKAHDIQKIDVLKVDVEGADTWVILGAADLIKQKRIKHIFFEINSNRMRELGIGHQEATDFLTRNGYTLEEMSPQEYHAYV